MVDLKTRRLPRIRRLQDLYDAARIVDALDHIHFFQRSLVAATWSAPWSSTSTRSMPASPARPSMSAPASAGADTLEAGARDPAPDRRRRGRLAGAAVRLACPAASSCRPCALPRTPAAAWRSRVARRHAGAAPVRRPGRRHLAGGARGLGRPGGGRGAGGPGLRQCAQARRARDLRHLAVRLGPAHRRHVGRQRRAGAADGRLRPDGPVLRPAHRRRLGHERFQAARRAVRLPRRATTTRWSAMPAPT